MSATIRDVARRAAVSPSTVSRTLNGSGYVSAAARQRVLAAVELLGYRPNRVARGLVGKSRQVIGLVLPDISNPFFPALARGVEDAADAAGYRVMLFNSDDRADKEAACCQACVEHALDGLILDPCGDDVAHLEPAVAAGLALVLVDRGVSRVPADSVGVDNGLGMTRLVEYLLALGHRRIGIITGPRALSVAAERLAAWEAALLGAGVRPAADWVAEGDFRFDGGYRAAPRLVAAGVTAIVASNDLMAIGALRALEERGVRVPEQVSVAGYDDIPAASWTRPALTTVRQPTYRMGFRAARLCLERIEDRRPRRPRRVRLRPRLVVRDSTGPPAAGRSAHG